jgi:hypothetical protein
LYKSFWSARLYPEIMIVPMEKPRIIHLIHPSDRTLTRCGRAIEGNKSQFIAQVTCQNCLDIINGDRAKLFPTKQPTGRSRPYAVRVYLSPEAYSAWQSLPNKTNAVNTWLESLAAESLN